MFSFALYMLVAIMAGVLVGGLIRFRSRSARRLSDQDETGGTFQRPAAGGPPQALHDRLVREGEPLVAVDPSPVLTLAEFFNGNNVLGSIGARLQPQLPPRVFHQAFDKLVSDHIAAEVLVVVTSYNPVDVWPTSDRILVKTDMPPDIIETSLESLQPSGGYRLDDEGANGLDGLQGDPSAYVVIYWE